MPRWFGYAAMGLGLVPLATVAWQGKRLPSAWWWLAVAFAVSFLADVAGLFGYGFLASQTYPVLQAGLFALILAARPVAVAVIGGLAVVSAVSLSWRGAAGLDTVLHLAAWGSTAFLAYRYLTDGMLKTTLLGGFLGLSLAWCWFTLDPSFLAWGAVQWMRLGTAIGFAMAAWQAARERTDGG